MISHEDGMKAALEEAQKASALGEIPIGSVLVYQENILARGHNLREQSRNPLDHAEMHVLRDGSALLKNWRLEDCTLYVTVEPCPMCLGALLQARVGRLVYGCSDPKRPALQATSLQSEIFQYPSLNQIQQLKGNNHTLEVTSGCLEEACSSLLKDFFKSRRS